MNITKKVALVLASVLFGYNAAHAVIVTNDLGQVIEVRTLGEVSTNTADAAAVPDWSSYARLPGQRGTIVRLYDFANQGGTAGAEIVLDPPIAVPANAVVTWGCVKSLTATVPATNTISIGLNSAVDLMAASTNLGVASTRALIPVGTVATQVAATNDVYIRAVPTGTITAGRFAVYLDYFLAPW